MYFWLHFHSAHKFFSSILVFTSVFFISCAKDNTEVDNYLVGGTVSGFVGSYDLTLQIKINGQSVANELLPISENGEFTFTKAVADGANFEVTVATDPVGRSCSVTNGTDTINAGDNRNILVECQNSAPELLQAPSNNSLGARASINIVFNEPMDTGSLFLGGTMAIESDKGTWGSTNYPNDTLTISPSVTWSLNDGHSLTIDINDTETAALTTLNLLHDIFVDSTIYVSDTQGNDDNTGTSSDAAKKTILSALQSATPPVNIAISGGSYTVDRSTDSQIILPEGVSLYGGYDSTFTTRDAKANETIINDIHSTAMGSFLGPACAVEIIGGITYSIIDGLTINGSTQVGSTYTAAICVRGGAKPTIQNNIINGGSGASRSYGIHVRDENSSPIIQYNDIHGGNSERTQGIMSTSSATPVVLNNHIYGGDATSVSAGYYSGSQGDLIVRNNLINSGTAGLNMGVYTEGYSTGTYQNNLIYGGAMGMYLFVSSPVVQNNIIVSEQRGISAGHSAGSTNPFIDNNIIIAVGTGTTYCIHEDSSESDPASLRNNNLFGCSVVYLDDDAGCTGNADGDNNNTTCTLEEMQALTDYSQGASSNNVRLDPEFVNFGGSDNNVSTLGNNDWHFNDTLAPIEVTEGGLNGLDDAGAGWGFTEDKDNNARPASGSPWSMGAYEP